MIIKDKKYLDSKYGKMNLARFLKSYRLTENLTQLEIAQKLGWSKGTICDIESGNVFIGIARAKLLANITGISLDYILEIILNQQLRDVGIKRYIKIKIEKKKTI